MKKHLLTHLFILFVFTLYVNNSANAQNQHPNWVLFCSDLSGHTQTANIGFKTNAELQENIPFYKQTPNVFTDENNQVITQYRGFNCFFDNDGFPVLYVINKAGKTYLFDKHGNKFRKRHSNPKGLYAYLSNQNNSDPCANRDYIEGFSPDKFTGGSLVTLRNTSREISILKVGCNLLHVISGEMIIEVDLTLKSWDYFVPYVPGTSTPYFSQFIEAHGITSVKLGNGGMEIYESFHAIRRSANNEGIYTIYFLYSTVATDKDSKPIYLTRVTVNANDYSVSFGEPYYLRNQAFPAMFRNDVQFISELEVSPDGRKIAVHDLQSVFVYGINETTRNVNEFLGYFDFHSPFASQQYTLSGLEFNATSDKLVFNIFDAYASAVPDVSNKIGALNLSAVSNYIFPVTYFTESIGSKTQSILCRGGLELGRNNEVYGVGRLGLYKLNFSTYFINDIPDVSITKIGTINLSDDPILGAGFACRQLPEQIDGQPFLSEGFQLDDDVFPNSDVGFEFDEKLTATGTYKIRGTIVINSKPDKSVVFLNTRVYPATGTEIQVNAEANLEITNTNIETNGCAQMWKGITVNAGGSLKVLNLSGTEKYIKDALVAIDYSGMQSGLLISNYTFNRNENSLVIHEAGVTGNRLFRGNVMITHNNFMQTEVLKDLSKGQSVLNRQNAHKGIASVVVNNTGTSNHYLLLEENTFNGGLFGIQGSNSFIHAAGCRFGSIQGISEINFFPSVRANYAAAILMQKLGTDNVHYGLLVDNNTSNNLPSSFTDNARHIVARNGVSVEIRQTSFSKSYQKGIEWVKNKGCSLTVINCNMLNCANAAIYADDNAFPAVERYNYLRTYLQVLGNNFSNDQYNISGTEQSMVNTFDGSAIYINELGKASDAGYNYFEISNNQINNLRTGIVLCNVVGNKSDLTNPDNRATVYDISDNTPILVRPQGNTIFPSGIHVVNARNLAVYNNYSINNVTPNRYSPLGHAIYLENSQYMSVKSNALMGKYGLRAKMNNIGSEILCNTFSHNRFGIMYSDKHMLRNTFQTHGTKDYQSRSNQYLQSGISDMHWIEPFSVPHNLWVIEYNGQVKEACYRAGTTQSCFGPYTIPGSTKPVYFYQSLIRDYAPDFCKGVFPAGLPYTLQPDTATDPVMQWELDFSVALQPTIENVKGNLTDKGRLIQATAYIQQQAYDSAALLLQQNFTRELDRKYASVLSRYVALYLPQPHRPDSADWKFFSNYAREQAAEEGSHVYVARSILQSIWDESYSEKDSIVPDIFIQLTNTQCLNNSGELTLRLTDAGGNPVNLQYAMDSLWGIQIFGECLSGLAANEVFTLTLTYLNQTTVLKESLTTLYRNGSNYLSLACLSSHGKMANPDIHQQQDMLWVYPNPVSGMIWLQGQDQEALYDISVFNASGMQVLNIAGHKLQAPIDLSNLSPGIYCLLVHSQNRNYTYKIQKQ